MRALPDPRLRRLAIGAALAAAVTVVAGLLAGCGGAAEGVTATPGTAAPGTAAPGTAADASPSSTPERPRSSAPWVVTDPRGDAPAFHLDLVGARASVQGDRLLVVFGFDALPDQRDQAALRALPPFQWRAQVSPGIGAEPRFVIDVNPRVHVGPAGTANLVVVPEAHEVRLDAPGAPPFDYWPAAVELDRVLAEVRIAVRLPDLGPGAQVQLLTYEDRGAGGPVEADQTSRFTPDAAPFELGLALPAPQRLASAIAEDGSVIYDLTSRGLPVRFVPPPGWVLDTTRLASGLVTARPPEDAGGGFLEFGVKVSDLSAAPHLLTGPAVLQRLNVESAGAYEQPPQEPFRVPQGFHGSVLVRAVRSSELGAEPLLLDHWRFREGSTLRLMVGIAGTHVVLAYVEASDWASAVEFLPWLQRVELVVAPSPLADALAPR